MLCSSRRSRGHTAQPVCKLKNERNGTIPKLANAEARQAEQANDESEERAKALPVGTYVGQLFEVDVSDSPGNSGFHYWIWKFRVLDDGYRGKEVRTNTSLSPKAAFKMGEVFAAFGVPADTHTDELYGQRVMLYVTQRHSDDGQRTFNDISRVMPYDSASTPFEESNGDQVLADDF